MNDALDPILQQEEQRRLRTQLIWRLGIAVALVAGVLGVLAWLDQGKEAPTKMTVAQPRDVRIAPRASVAASAPTASAPIAAATASTPQASAPIAEASKPVSPVPAAASAPEPAAQTSRPQVGQPTLPPFKTPAVSAPAKPVPPGTARSVPPTEAVKPFSPAKPEIQTQGTARPLPEKQAPRAGEPAVRYPAPVSTPNGYTVQAGVFLHSSNAEKLLKQLQTTGVPAYLETRVQIGPFRNKAEAEAAVRKLRQAGIAPVLKTN